MFMTFLLGVKFIDASPVMTDQGSLAGRQLPRSVPSSPSSGAVWSSALHLRLSSAQAAAAMMPLILTSVLGYELQNRRGLSVFIMTFTALTARWSPLHAIGGAPDWPVLGAVRGCSPCCGRASPLCLANKADAKTL
ncbi:MAG: hypothetical protein ACLVJH_19165 [Faecalibacterium prausnitzii]